MIQKHTLYISYADADEDWVIDFVKNLKVNLPCQQLKEKIGDSFIWAKYMASGLDKPQDFQKHLNNSRYLIVVLSGAYLAEMDEIDKFNNKENIIVVEHDKVDRPKKLKEPIGYRFWKEDKTGTSIKQFSKRTCSTSYLNEIEQIARDFAKKLIELSHPAEEQNSNQQSAFLWSSDKYSLEPNTLKEFIKNEKLNLLPKTNNFESELQQADFFIQLGNDEKGNDLYEIAKKLHIPTKRWTDDKNHASSTHIYSDIESFKIDIRIFINNGNIHNSNINTGNNAQQQNSISSQSSSPAKDNKMVFVNTIDEDRDFATSIQEDLVTRNVMSVSIPKNTEFTSREEILDELTDKLLFYNAVIIICDKAPILWVHRQIEFCNKVRLNRPENFKIIAVFNKPPPKNLEKKELGCFSNNLKIYNNCPGNCVEKFTETLKHE